MLAILNSLNAHNFPIFEPILIILVSKFMVYRVLSEKIHLSLGLLAPIYSKTSVKQPLSKRPQIGFHDQLSLKAGQKYCRMLRGEHSAILLTCIKLQFVFKIFVLSIFEWLFTQVLLISFEMTTSVRICL